MQLPKPEQNARDRGILKTDWGSISAQLTECCKGCPSAATQAHCGDCELYFLKLTVGQCYMRKMWLQKKDK